MRVEVMQSIPVPTPPPTVDLIGLTMEQAEDLACILNWESALNHVLSKSTAANSPFAQAIKRFTSNLSYHVFDNARVKVR
jgi:hypothetical protein